MCPGDVLGLSVNPRDAFGNGILQASRSPWARRQWLNSPAYLQQAYTASVQLQVLVFVASAVLGARLA